jgi:hypothetical protein
MPRMPRGIRRRAKLESYAKRIAALPGRKFAGDRRRVHVLIEKLYAVEWP